MKFILIASFCGFAAVLFIPIASCILGRRLRSRTLWLLAKLVLFGGCGMTIAAAVLLIFPVVARIGDELALSLMFGGLALFLPSVALIQLAKRADDIESATGPIAGTR